MPTLRRICSLLFLVTSLASCQNGPKVTVCVSRPESKGFICVDGDQNQTTLLYEDSDKYVAFSPDDAQALIEYCGVKKQSQDAMNVYWRLMGPLVSR